MQEKQPSYQVKEWEEERKKNEKLMDNIWFFGYKASDQENSPSKTFYISNGNRTFQKLPDIKSKLQTNTKNTEKLKPSITTSKIVNLHSPTFPKASQLPPKPSVSNTLDKNLSPK